MAKRTEFPGLLVLFLFLLVISLAVWFGIFFGVNYPEIYVHEKYKESNCEIISKEQNKYTCCSTSCRLCYECEASADTCANLQAKSLFLDPGFTASCCNGYHCCRECCDVCERCHETCDTAGRCHTTCEQYQCNCRCCDWVNDRECRFTCTSCYKPSATVRYSAVIAEGHPSTVITSTYQYDCGTTYTPCVTDFMLKYQLNMSYPCWYDPQSPYSVTMDKNYTAWKMVLLAFASGFPVILIAATGITLLGFVIALVKKRRNQYAELQQ